MVPRKNPRKVFPSYNTHIQVKVKEIKEFLLKHEAVTVSLNPRKILQLETLQTDLRDQFRGMETAWDNMKDDPTNESIFDEVEGWITTAKEAVNNALLDSETFLEAKEASAQASGNAADTAPSAGTAKLDSTLRPKNALSRAMSL
jgi:hypothetical protein